MRTYFRVKGGHLEEVKGEVVREQPLTVHVNGERFVTLLCSPFQLEALVVGYLWMEKVIEDLSEITRIDISEVDGRAEVTLAGPVTLPTERILTSGCGGGITFRIDPRLFPRLRSSIRVRPEQLAARLKELFGRAVHYQASRGIHGAALADAERLLVVAEDVGRHNAVDKVVGHMLRTRRWPLDRHILLVSGRASFEIMQKAWMARIPIVAAVSAPSSMAVEMSLAAGITLVGFLRRGGFNVYAGAQRVTTVAPELV
jgi:FdhD protein